MNLQKEIKLLVIPLIKSSPVIVLLVVLALLGMQRAITYMTPVYQASGAIKINNLEYTQNGFMLFGKEEGAKHQQNQNFLTEVEVFRSRDLISQTLIALEWELGIYRQGRFRLVELGNESPLEVVYEKRSPEAFEQKIALVYKGEDQFVASIINGTDSVHFNWQDTVQLKDWQFSLQKNEVVLDANPNCLQTGDQFQLHLHKLKSLLDKVDESALFVKPVEKDVSIVKLYYKHERPEKAQAFVNQLMYTYIDECRFAKEQQTDSTLLYLDQQLQDVSQSLSQAEGQLAFYRTQTGLVDTKLETDAQLRTIMQMDLQKMDIEVKQGELQQLYTYLQSGNQVADFSPNLETLQDPVFREAFLKMQAFDLQLEDMLSQYVPTSEEIQNLESKINQLHTFLNESVRNSLDNLDYKQSKLEKAVDRANEKLNEMPAKEKQLVSLQRTVALQEAMYNYLIRKRTELSINRSSNLYPHKVIDHARLPEGLAAPNKPLLYGLAILLALMAGTLFAYLRHYFTARVRYAEDLEERLAHPVLASVYRSLSPEKAGANDGSASFRICSNLLANLHQLAAVKAEQKLQLLTVTSMTPGEGKSFVSAHLAKALAEAGKQVLLIDADLRKPQLHELLGVKNEAGLTDLLLDRAYELQPTHQAGLRVLTAGQTHTEAISRFYDQQLNTALTTWKQSFDYIIIDTPPVGLFQELIPCMQSADLNLFVLRADYTHTRRLRAIRQQLEELSGLNFSLLLNDTIRARTLPGYRQLLRKYYRA